MMEFEEFKKAMISGFREIMRGRRPLRYIHYSTGSGYRPRSMSPGFVRKPEQKGETYNVGNNQRKREKRALRG